jgi:hypothetical protein
MRNLKIITSNDPVIHQDNVRSFLTSVNVIIQVKHFVFPVPVQAALKLNQQLSFGFIFMSFIDYE